MAVQIDKARFDMKMEGWKFAAQMIALGLSAAGVVIAAFAAGRFLQ